MGIWDTDLISAAFADAAMDPSRWHRSLDLISVQTESRGAILIPVSGGAVPGFPVSESLIEVADHYKRDGWHLRDERMLGADRLTRNAVLDDLEIVSPDWIQKSAYYQEFLAAHDLRWFVGVKIAAGDDLWCLSIQRTIAQGPFSPGEKDYLRSLSNRLSTSAILARAFGTAGANGAMEAFEMSGKAVMLVNRRGEIFLLNPLAEKMLDADVRLENRKLVSFDPVVTQSFNRALNDLIFEHPNRAALGPPVSFPRKGRRPLLVYPARLSPAAANPLADCQAIAVLVDLESPIGEIRADTLRKTFGLSAAESRLAGLIGAGVTLEVATENLGIAKETGRSQLKSIFYKMGISRQAELIAMLGSILRMSRE